MKNTIYLSLLIISFSIVSCKKKEIGVNESTTAAVLTLNSPVKNQSFNFGDTVKINGIITADLALHGYQVRVVNLTTGMNVLNHDYHVHENSIIVNESWKNTVSDTTQMKIIIDAAVDHDGNLSTLERLIICYPQ